MRFRKNSEFMTRDEVLAYFGGISRTTLYRGIKRGTYPKQVRVGDNTVRWRRDEIYAARDALNRRAEARA